MPEPEGPNMRGGPIASIIAYDRFQNGNDHYLCRMLYRMPKQRTMCHKQGNDGDIFGVYCARWAHHKLPTPRKTRGQKIEETLAAARVFAIFRKGFPKYRQKAKTYARLYPEGETAHGHTVRWEAWR